MTIHNPKIKMQSALMEAVSRVASETKQIIERDVSDSEFRAIISKDIKEKLISPEEVNTLLNMCQQAAGDEAKELKCKAKLVSFVMEVGRRAAGLPKPSEVEGPALTTLGASNLLQVLVDYNRSTGDIEPQSARKMSNARFLDNPNDGPTFYANAMAEVLSMLKTTDFITKEVPYSHKFKDDVPEFLSRVNDEDDYEDL